MAIESWMWYTFGTILVWIIIWDVIYINTKFKNRRYSLNKELLQFDYKRFQKLLYHFEVISCGCIVGGFTSKNITAQQILLLGGFGIMFIFVPVMFGRTVKIELRLREILKKKNKF